MTKCSRLPGRSTGLTRMLAVAMLLFMGSVRIPRAADADPDCYVSSVWVSDQGDGTYRNPVLYADYSDPDVCRVGDDFYMTASSFNCVPALPLLHSKDLVNWSLIGHALDRLEPEDVFARPQHGNGVWAPSIRHHNGRFYIYWGDPDFGIYMTSADEISGPWTRPALVKEGKGLIDPCPLWDDDGTPYLSHAFAGSRAGLKSVLLVTRMTPDGTRAIGASRIVFDGHGVHRTIEGTKFHKRDGFYYLFAPAGGVSHGWQVVLRAEDPFGPYKAQVVLAQGNTGVNGPHQGAWIELENGEHWFVHFQDAEAYGRIVHLQPMRWLESGFPVMGVDEDGDGTGEPVLAFAKPNVGATHPVCTPVESDEFESGLLGVQWQWHANPSPKWHYANARDGFLRLYCRPTPEDARNMWDVPNLLLQKLSAPTFTATAKVTFTPQYPGEKAGLIVMGEDYSYLAIEHLKGGRFLVRNTCRDARRGAPENAEERLPLDGDTIYVRVSVVEGGLFRFSYSPDGSEFTDIGSAFQAVPGRWIGAKVGFFAVSAKRENDSGWLDIDWYRVTQ